MGVPAIPKLGKTNAWSQGTLSLLTGHAKWEHTFFQKRLTDLLQQQASVSHISFYHREPSRANVLLAPSHCQLPVSGKLEVSL